MSEAASGRHSADGSAGTSSRSDGDTGAGGGSSDDAEVTLVWQPHDIDLVRRIEAALLASGQGDDENQAASSASGGRSAAADGHAFAPQQPVALPAAAELHQIAAAALGRRTGRAGSGLALRVFAARLVSELGVFDVDDFLKLEQSIIRLLRQGADLARDGVGAGQAASGSGEPAAKRQKRVAQSVIGVPPARLSALERPATLPSASGCWSCCLASRRT
jgi:hypothetical protein